MSSLSAIVAYPRGRVASLPPGELIRAGQTRCYLPCSFCGHDDGQYIALPLATRLQVWCVLGDGHPDGARLAWGFRGPIWYFALDAGTMHRLLSRVARSFGLRESSILSLPASTESTHLPQVMAEGLPCAQVQQARVALLARVADALAVRGEALTVRVLAAKARISLNVVCAWLWYQRTATSGTEVLLSAMPEDLALLMTWQCRPSQLRRPANPLTDSRPVLYLMRRWQRWNRCRRFRRCPLKASVLLPAINCSGAGLLTPGVVCSALSTSWRPPFDQPGEENTHAFR